MIGPGTGVRVVSCVRDHGHAQGSRGPCRACAGCFRQKATGGAVFAFHGKRGDRLKLLYFDGQGFCLYYNDRRSYYTSFLAS
ncbi:IS66 family insertion sequence element accessory protein TnpB [Rhizobium redzepovicii]